MKTNSQLVIITSSPHSHQHKLAIEHVQTRLQLQQPTSVFFYADAAYIANQLNWQTADIVNPAQCWQKLADTHQLRLPVCVSTALARGVSDAENSERHQLPTHNLHPSFQLVGLSDLVALIDQNETICQF